MVYLNKSTFKPGSEKPARYKNETEITNSQFYPTKKTMVGFFVADNGAPQHRLEGQPPWLKG